MKKKRVLVIAAHPDDEILGCGGAMAIHSKKGDKVFSLILSQGILSRTEDLDKNFKIKALKKNSIKANRTVGVKKTFHENFPDNAFDTVKLLEIIKSVEAVLRVVKPNIIYTHHKSDLNIDHNITNRAVLTAVRPLPNSQIEKVLTFEVNSSTEWSIDHPKDTFIANYFVSFDRFILSKKLKALSYYKSEMRKWPHARSLKAIKVLAQRRGSNIGLDFAEGFSVIRIIKK